MKNKYIGLLFFVAFPLLFGSCSKYLDINQNPNNADEVDPKLLFSFATTTLINNRAGGDLFIPMALGGQSMAGGGSSTDGVSWGTGSEDSYVFSTFSYGNIWTQYYTSIGFNLKYAIDQAENGIPKNDNGAAQCKVILAETMYELTTIYGDVPYSEALNENIRQPKFDTQQEVFESVINLLDEALAQFEPLSEFKFGGTYDLFYQGSIDNWIKAANSLKLRVLMTMVDKDPSKASAIGTLLTADNFISSSSENMKGAFIDAAGKRNPKYAINNEYNGGIDFFYGSTYVVNFMNATNDPRLPKFFDKGEDVPGYVGIQPGANATDGVHAKIAQTLHTAAQPEYIFTYQEQLFYEAEIYARGLGVDVDLATANTLYKQAIIESGVFFGVDANVMTTYVNGLPNLTSMSAADALKAIHYQHWIDKFDRGIDAFTQWRRSGPAGAEIPVLTLPVNAPAGSLFRRYEYPSTAELFANPKAPPRVAFNEKMWFDL